MATGMKPIQPINCRKLTAAVILTCWTPSISTIVFRQRLMKNSCTAVMKYRPVPLTPFCEAALFYLQVWALPTCRATGGVIEILRRKGYKLRPVKMGERASREKDLVEKIRVPVVFTADSADDGLFKVDIPGRFYKFGDDAALNQQQCADMANGSYYLVTRIMTNAWMWNHSEDDVYRVVDSLLYENVPGKIISKTTISRNGYKGFNVVNRTRRGDMQRYNIFITPFEVIFFKMSGNGDYVKNGPEAEKFFGSIRIREYKNGNGSYLKKFSPAYGGFVVELPHEPYVGNDGSWIYDAADKTNGIHYRVIRTDIHNFHFAGEDTFDLSLMEGSFMTSEFVDTALFRRQHIYKSYPALDGKYRDKSGALYFTRFLIQGPHYYTLVARSRQETPAAQRFLNSFEIKPFIYGTNKLQKDTSFYYAVNTPWYPEGKKIKLNIPQYSWVRTDDEEGEKTEKDQLESGIYRNKIIRNDSTGERIFVSFFRSSRYAYLKDSAGFEKDSRLSFFTDSTYTFRLKKKSELPDKTKVWESVITDTASSRILWTKMYYKDGYGYTLATQSDSLTPPGSFIKQFFESFTPADTMKGINPFVKKSNLFFEDFGSKDTVLHNRAVDHIADIYLDSSDLPMLKNAITSLGWEHKKYLETKREFINKLADIKSKETADYLKQLYYALNDTVQLQYAVLENLLQHKTTYAYSVFRDIINTGAPVLDFSGSDYIPYGNYGLLKKYLSSYGIKNGKFLDELSDSLKLTLAILPDLLPLLNLEDYKPGIMELIGQMVDSNLVQPRDYEAWFSKFLIEAKQELKKQAIAEKKKAIAKAEESKNDKKKPSYLSDDDNDDGNADLGLYAKLLLPFTESNTAVKPVIEQMLKSADKRLKYNTFMLLLQKGKSFPDTLLNYFAGLDEYRYELYRDLKENKKIGLFPAKYNNHFDLGRSTLYSIIAYEKPDSLVFIQRLSAVHKNKRGYVYFYKYKTKKDDLTWRLATVGLTPEDPEVFELEENKKTRPEFYSVYLRDMNRGDYEFSRFSEIKLKEEEPLEKQLQKELKRLLYSARESAKEFYKDEDTGTEAEY